MDNYNFSTIQTTTGLDDACTDDFTEISAATPLVSGVVTLALQAKYVAVMCQYVTVIVI